jgi:hypothetical protein
VAEGESLRFEKEREMKSRINQRDILKLRFLILPMSILILFACVTVPSKTYEETILQWKSYDDVAKWMKENFSYDINRAKEAVRTRSIIVRTPKETFELKSGVCFDAARFAKEMLDCIDPSYEAQIVYIENRPYEIDHYVCSFKKDNRLYILDYGTFYRNMVGTHGPFNSLEEYKKFYERNHPKVKKVQSISYGWPSRVRLAE